MTVPGNVSPDVARAAIGLHRSHPHVPALDVLDACMRQRAGSVEDFGRETCNPDHPFGALIAQAFDIAMTPAEWAGLLSAPRLDPQQREALLEVWRTHVLSRFVDRYGLTG